MSLPLNWFLNPSETKENVNYMVSRYNPADLDSYNKPSLPFMQQIREYTRSIPITAAVSTVLQNISQYVGNMVDAVPIVLDKVVEGVKDATQSAAYEIGGNYEEVVNAVEEAVVQNENLPAPAKKTFPKVQTPYIQNGKLHRIGAGSLRRRHKSKSRSRKHKKHYKKSKSPKRR